MRQGIKVLFASCSHKMAARAVTTVAGISPELDLVVVSAQRPEQGRWIKYCPGESVRGTGAAFDAASVGTL